jgi:hypothetical protein
MKRQHETCEMSNDLIVFNLYLPKFSKSKTQMLNHKLNNILIIWHISVKIAQALWYKCGRMGP